MTFGKLQVLTPNSPNSTVSSISLNPSGIAMYGGIAITAGVLGSQLTFGKITPLGVVVGIVEAGVLSYAGAIYFIAANAKGKWIW